METKKQRQERLRPQINAQHQAVIAAKNKERVKAGLRPVGKNAV